MSHKSLILSTIALISVIYLLRSTTSSHNSFYIGGLQMPKGSVNESVSDICGSSHPGDHFTDAELQTVSNIEDFLEKARGGRNPLLDYFKSEEEEDDIDTFAQEYAKGLIPFAAVGGVLFLISIVTCCFFCKNCKCCKGCLKDTIKRKRTCAFIGLALTLVVVGVGVAGFYYSYQYSAGFEKAECSGAKFLGTFTLGDMSLSWIGLDSFIKQMTVVAKDIVDTINNLPDIDSADQKLENLYDQGTSDIKDLYDNHRSDTVTNPNPNGADITPDFVAELGPPSNDDSVTGLLQQELDFKDDTINDLMKELNSSISDLQDQADTITKTINDGIDTANDLNAQISSVLYSYSNTSVQTNAYMEYFGYGLMTYFGIFLAFSFFVLLSMIGILLAKCDPCTKISHASWGCLNTLVIFGALFTAVLFPVLIASMEGCEVTQYAITNQTILDNLIHQIHDVDDNITEYTNICFYGDGNILAKFGIEEEMDELKTVFDGLQNVTDYFNSSSPNSEVIPIEQHYIDLFKSGELPVSDDVGESLVILNTYTDYSVNHTQQTLCKVSQDLWELNQLNCSDSAYKPFQGNKANYNYGLKTCMGIMDWKNNDKLQYKNRYSVTSMPNCGFPNGMNYSDFVVQSLQGFETHMDSVDTVFSAIEEDLNTYSATNDQYMDEIRTVVNPLIQANETVFTILDLLGNNQTGIIPNFNCSFIRISGQTFVDNVCVSYLSNFFMSVILMLVLGVVTLIALIPVFCVTKVMKNTAIREKRAVNLGNYRHLNDNNYEMQRPLDEYD